MRSAGMAKIAIAFTIGVALALGGAGLYKRLASHPGAVDQTATTPAVPDGPDKLPDDDATPAVTAVRPPAVPPIQKPAVPATLPALAKRATKRRIEATHAPVRRTLTAALKKTQYPAEPPRQIAQLEPPAPNPYTENQPAPAPAPELAPAAPVASAPEPPQPRQPRTVNLPSGTRLLVRLNQTLSSDHNFAGDTFQATLESPIVLANALILERGSKVVGKVVSVQRGARGDAASDISVTLTQINTTDGQRVPVQTSTYDQHAKRNGQRDAEKVGGGAALGAIIGAIAGGGKGAAIGAGVGGAAGGGDVLFTRGRPAVLQTEAQLDFQITAPVNITERLNN